MIRRPTHGHRMMRSESLTDEKRWLLEVDSWEVVQKKDVMLALCSAMRSKSEISI